MESSIRIGKADHSSCSFPLFPSGDLSRHCPHKREIIWRCNQATWSSDYSSLVSCLHSFPSISFLAVHFSSPTCSSFQVTFQCTSLCSLSFSTPAPPCSLLFFFMLYSLLSSPLSPSISFTVLFVLQPLLWAETTVTARGWWACHLSAGSVEKHNDDITIDCSMEALNKLGLFGAAVCHTSSVKKYFRK